MTDFNTGLRFRLSRYDGIDQQRKALSLSLLPCGSTPRCSLRGRSVSGLSPSRNFTHEVYTHAAHWSGWSRLQMASTDECVLPSLLPCSVTIAVVAELIEEAGL